MGRAACPILVRTLVGVCAVLVAGVAAAQPSGDPDAGPLTPTRVTVARSGTMARLGVRFEMAVTGPAPEYENTESVAIPSGAVITGATVRVGDHVEALQLARLDKVDAAFAALLERPGKGHDRRWGIRIDATDSDAKLAIAAAHDATATIDITLEAATCFADDARHVKVPETWQAHLPAATAPALTQDDLDEMCAVPGEGRWIALPSGELARHAAGDARIGVTVGRLPLGSRDIARVELALAGTLTEIPKDLYTAIVVDHSRSLTETERENQRAILEAYLRATPRGRVQVIQYARTAEPLLSSWSLAERAATRIDRAIRGMAPRNGSNVDDALAAAGSWLGNVQGTRRVLLMTDERVADRVSADPAALAKLLPAGTLVHAVALSGATGTVQRTDDALFAPLALATGGIAALVGSDDHGALDVLPLARPVSLDNITISGTGWTANLSDDRPCPGELEAPFAEGRSCVWWAEGKRASGDVTVTGWLWGRKVTRVVAPDPAQARRVARMMSMMSALPPELELEVKTAALAVNSVWALFAMWGGSGGYQDIETWGFGLSGMSCCGGGRTITDTIGTVGMLGARLDLHPQLAGAVSRCHPGGDVTLVIETTLEEIVDVEVRGAVPAVADCINEGVWDTMLSLPNAPSHAHTTVLFQPT